MHFCLPELQFRGVSFGNAEATYSVIQAIMHELIDEALDIPTSERLDWNKVLNNHRATEGNRRGNPAQLRQELCPSIRVSRTLSLPLDKYTREY